jgi:hypothetical protein
MKNDNQNFQVGRIPMNSDDRFYPSRSSLITEGEGQSPSQTWWARSYNQGLPVTGGRYVFLRGAWLPENPCAGWNASASWGTCAPSTGEAC